MSSHIVRDNTNIKELSDNLIVRRLVNKDLSVLTKENFIIFPQQLSDSDDLDKEHYIFQTRNNELRTCNIVGIISDGTDDIRINSRFTKEGKDDYFLQYMIQQVLNYNVIDSELGSSKEMSYYDLLVFLFPYYLNEALIKGVYKEYVHHKYNDANIKGPIDVARHIKHNIPFIGNVAYSTREFSYDNNVTELIRHTVEKIQLKYGFLLVENEDIKDNVRTIKKITNSYNRLDREDVIQNNILNPVKSGYFEEYAIIQRLCIQILTEEKTDFGDEDNQINGIIIDVAWLWEEYIWKVTGWDHYGRGIKSMRLFSDNSKHHRYPDFVFDSIPIDTKYKKIIDTRNDYNQLATYMHIMNSSIGGFLQPSQDKSGYAKIGIFDGMGGTLFTYNFNVPQSYENYDDFVEQMHKAESNLKFLQFINWIEKGKQIEFTYLSVRYSVTYYSDEREKYISLVEFYKELSNFSSVSEFMENALIGDKYLKDIWKDVKEIEVL